MLKIKNFSASGAGKLTLSQASSRLWRESARGLQLRAPAPYSLGTRLLRERGNEHMRKIRQMETFLAKNRVILHAKLSRNAKGFIKYPKNFAANFFDEIFNIFARKLSEM